MDQQTTQRRRRFGALEAIQGFLALLALGISVTQITTYAWLEPQHRLWFVLASTLIIAVPILVCIVAVASAAPANPLIRRDSLLWKWMRGLGIAFGGALTFGVATYTGVILGSARTGDELASAAQVVIFIAGVWLGLAWTWWFLVATIDLARLGRAGRAAAIASLVARGSRRPRAIAGVAAAFASPWGALICGLVGLVGLIIAGSSAVTWLSTV